MSLNLAGKCLNCLAIGLLFTNAQHAGRVPECVVSCPGSKKKLHPSDGVASPEFYFPHREDFQEASDWPSEGPLPPKRPFLSKLKRPFLLENHLILGVTGKS
jgi:hypothetical protein